MILAFALSTSMSCSGRLTAHSPAFKLTLPTTGSGPRSFAEFHGHAVVALFLTTWCTPCQLLLRRILQARAAYGTSRVTVVLVITDPNDTLVPLFVQALNLDVPVFLGSPKHMLQAGKRPVLVVPTTLVLDRAGRIVRLYRRIVTTKMIAQDLGRALAAPR
ncbi:MAG: TlpA family protein disulfide reductase [Deltaproteobacteria bacterium]|nr:TlpA family protein disulfide reductase [Deltaproteobacteria bacterium]